jgi:glycosyltransferase involved in cell wall biosynthesis
VLSFVVPAHNEELLLGHTLGAINDAARALGEPFEVRVADDASTDRTADAARAVIGNGRGEGRTIQCSGPWRHEVFFKTGRIRAASHFPIAAPVPGGHRCERAIRIESQVAIATGFA